MRIVWTTDPHLNHVPVLQWDRWIALIESQRPDAILVTGDISEGDDVVFQLNRMSEAFRVPLRFVLGNHDFYQSSIAETRRRVIASANNNPLLKYLTFETPTRLTDGVYLIGEDGWGDATCGDYLRSQVKLNDFVSIEDFITSDRSNWQSQLQQQGKQSAERLRTQLQQLPANASDVIVATHVPPFCEACWYEGHTTDDNWAPFFVCGQVGDQLKQFADDNPKIQLHVLCGHTHHAGIANLAGNLTVFTGAAVYGQPDVEAVVHVQDGKCDVSLLRS
ncbi:metallophosphoesterase family protein [Planctomycetes bacterium K23_9]|uniref:Calcineurin-like phosphoesterase n=1 Tax=Stieleria marina TaxID=1930275 RepID=A0A517P316_9BACT|nr:Calcineurin-like phosphoesterase [Planctomycetes bacterium K23_9]